VEAINISVSKVVILSTGKKMFTDIKIWHLNYISSVLQLHSVIAKANVL
jgi:hypothetical protein